MQILARHHPSGGTIPQHPIYEACVVSNSQELQAEKGTTTRLGQTPGQTGSTAAVLQEAREGNSYIQCDCLSVAIGGLAGH